MKTIAGFVLLNWLAAAAIWLAMVLASDVQFGADPMFCQGDPGDPEPCGCPWWNPGCNEC